MATPIAIDHSIVRQELESIISILETQLRKLDAGQIRRAEENDQHQDDPTDPDTALLRFRREIEFAGQKATTLAGNLEELS